MSPILDIQRRHAEVFRLRFGEKGSRGEPKKLTDAMRVTSHSREVVDAFTAVYGGDAKPWDKQWEAYLPITEIPVMVLPGQSIIQWWELWKGNACQRRCDGYTEQQTGKACLCDPDITTRMGATNQCRPMTRVNLLCPDVAVVGAGSMVSHGMIAAETMPQSIAVAEAALQRGIMVPAILRVVEHKGRRQFIVPQLEIVGVTLHELVAPSGVEPRAALTAGARPASEEERVEAQVPPPALPPPPPVEPVRVEEKPTVSDYPPEPPPLPDEDNWVGTFRKLVVKFADPSVPEGGAIKAMTAYLTNGRTRFPDELTEEECKRSDKALLALRRKKLEMYADLNGVWHVRETRLEGNG